MSSQCWQPSASLRHLRKRAEVLSQVRSFFSQRDVLEVETPLLAAAIGTDPNLSPIEAQVEQRRMFLQTSPEFAMKRLLADGSGPIFQICKAFRQGETGKKHNPEFTMLEWYRPGWTLIELMHEVEQLVLSVWPVQIDKGVFQHISYRDIFQNTLAIDPHTISLEELKSITLQHIVLDLESEDKDLWLDLLFSHVIEPTLIEPVFIYHYPKTQAALAQTGLDDVGQEVAFRFELVINGMELANGYFELTDPEEQKNRFAQDQQKRIAGGLTTYPIDEKYLAALLHGLPSCAGVALGFDRLLMLLTESESINDIISFPIARA